MDSTAPTAPRGILKPAGRPFPPPRKSSLSATAGKIIVKKYRKVRVSRLLRFKLIQAVAGFRTDRTRLPDADPDEEEQGRLAEKEKDEEMRKKREAREARARKRRKTMGESAAAPSSDDESGAEEASGAADLITARSPDVYCEAYMHVDSPDAVLTDREAPSWRDRQLHTVGNALFPINCSREDTVAQTTVSIAAKPSQPPRRRSLRIQERDEARRVQAEAAAAAAAAAPVQVEKRQRRRSRMFTTPTASPVARRKRSSIGSSNEKSDKSQRRKSRMFVRQPAASADEMSEKSHKSDEQMEFARCSDSYESQCTQWSSGCELLAEAFSPPRKPMRRGRRSMKIAPEDIPSATVLVERKPAAAIPRRTLFVSQKSLPEPEDEESDGDCDEVVKKMRRLSVLPGKDDVQ